MELKLKEGTAKRLYPESPEWFKEVLKETFGEKYFKKKSFNEIKTYEDACEERPVDEEDRIYPTDAKHIASLKKLFHIRKVLVQDWIPDYTNTNQKKWYGWFDLSSGFGFSGSIYDYDDTGTGVGSRLCFPEKEMCDYFCTQFIDLHSDILIINK